MFAKRPPSWVELKRLPRKLGRDGGDALQLIECGIVLSQHSEYYCQLPKTPGSNQRILRCWKELDATPPLFNCVLFAAQPSVGDAQRAVETVIIGTRYELSLECFTSRVKGGLCQIRFAHEFIAGEDWKGQKFTDFETLSETGELVEWGFGAAPGVSAKTAPSWLLTQARGTLPIFVQQGLALAAGEIDEFEAISKSLGFKTSRQYIKKK